MSDIKAVGPSKTHLIKQFSAGSIPTQQDFYDLIDILWAGRQAIEPYLEGVDETGGLEIEKETGRLRVRIGPGLHLVQDDIAVNPRSGDIAVNPGSGVKITEGGAVALNLKEDGGLYADEHGLQLSLGAGLIVESGKLAVGVGPGLEINDDGNIVVGLNLIGVDDLPDIVRNLDDDVRAVIYELLSGVNRITAEQRLDALKARVNESIRYIKNAISIANSSPLHAEIFGQLKAAETLLESDSI